MKSDWLNENGVYIAWALALASMLGSLYFSEFAGLPPCNLCWYQRIAMYPLVWIIGIGILRRDAMMTIYALPLAVVGTIIALYQNLLDWGVITEELLPCAAGISCTDNPAIALNFITIPLLSLAAFVAITVLLWLKHRSNNK